MTVRELKIDIRKDGEPEWHFVQRIDYDDKTPVYVQQKHFFESLQNMTIEAVRKLFEDGK